MVKIVEVGPRDGLQNETAPIPTRVKTAFIDALSESGVGEIEVSAFVSRRWVPQLGDAEDVFAGIARHDGVIYSALVPNERGLDRALSAGVDKVAVFTGASETFSRKNTHATIAESLLRYASVVSRAQRERLPVRGYLSAAFWCSYEGKTDPPAALDVIRRLFDLGVDEVSIADTVGRASPDDVRRLLDVLLPWYPAKKFAMHFHDTYGRAVANVHASWECGIRIFDSSTGGLGGCPFAPGATGNVATEEVVKALESMGERVGVDCRRLVRARRLLDPFLENGRRRLPEQELPGCAGCEYAAGEVCCRVGAARSGRRDPVSST
jgi:hydroxymethylglutaryl-CoA lyase